MSWLPFVGTDPCGGQTHFMPLTRMVGKFKRGHSEEEDLAVCSRSIYPVRCLRLHPERELLKESDEHAPRGRLDIWGVVGRNRG